MKQTTDYQLKTAVKVLLLGYIMISSIHIFVRIS